MFMLFGKLKTFPMMHWGDVIQELALNLWLKAHGQAECLWVSHLPNQPPSCPP